MRKSILALLIPILLSADYDFDVNDQQRRGRKGDFHFRTGYAYSVWKTDEMQNFEMKNKGLSLGWAELIYKDYYSPIFYPKFLLHFEHSFSSSEAPNEIFNERKSVNLDDSYLKVLGSLQFNNGLYLEYGYEKFSSMITSKNDNNYFMNESENVIPFPLNSKMVSETIFRDYIVGYSRKSGVNVYAFFSDYQKPYTIRRYENEVDGLSNLLLYPKLTSYGVGFKWYIGSDNFYLIPELKLGTGKMELTNDTNYEDFDGVDGVTYLGIKLRTGFTGELTKSLNYHISYVGEMRSFSESDSSREETEINSDVTHKALISLQYSF